MLLFDSEPVHAFKIDSLTCIKCAGVQLKRESLCLSLPCLAAIHSPQHCVLAHLLPIGLSTVIQVEWKLTRGKWRPKLLDYAKMAPEDTVMLVTRQAFDFLETHAVPTLQQVEVALDKLTTLKVWKHLLLLNKTWHCCEVCFAKLAPLHPQKTPTLHHQQIACNSTQACMVFLTTDRVLTSSCSWPI